MTLGLFSIFSIIGLTPLAVLYIVTTLLFHGIDSQILLGVFSLLLLLPCVVTLFLSLLGKLLDLPMEDMSFGVLGVVIGVVLLGQGHGIPEYLSRGALIFQGRANTTDLFVCFTIIGRALAGASALFLLFALAILSIEIPSHWILASVHAETVIPWKSLRVIVLSLMLSATSVWICDWLLGIFSGADILIGL